MLRLQRGGAPVSLCGVGDTRASQKTVGRWLRNSARLLEGHRLRRIEAVGRHAGEADLAMLIIDSNELMHRTDRRWNGCYGVAGGYDAWP